MKYTLTIRLVDCKPARTSIQTTLDTNEEAMEWADSVYQANAMIISAWLHNKDSVLISAYGE